MKDPLTIHNLTHYHSHSCRNPKRLAHSDRPDESYHYHPPRAVRRARCPRLPRRPCPLLHEHCSEQDKRLILSTTENKTEKFKMPAVKMRPTL